MKKVKMKMSRDFSEELMNELINYHKKLWMKSIGIAYSKLLSNNIKQSLYEKRNKQNKN